MKQSSPQPRFRFIDRAVAAGAPKIIGGKRMVMSDMYAHLLASPWWQLSAVIFSLYLSVNLLFTLAYLAIGDGIENAAPGAFGDAFFFSVQTLATIGYGQLSPHGLGGNMLASFEAFCGFSFYALITGLVFAKFSMPRARVLFSNVAIIAPHNGVPHLMLRMGNQRANRIVSAEVTLVLFRSETTQEGEKLRRFHDMNIVRSRVPFMRLTWLVMHPIDSNSPLCGLTAEELAQCDAEIIVSLTGLDETFGQVIHAHHSYLADEVLFNRRFEDVIVHDTKGRLTMRFDRFHDLRDTETTAR